MPPPPKHHLEDSMSTTVRVNHHADPEQWKGIPGQTMPTLSQSRFLWAPFCSLCPSHSLSAPHVCFRVQELVPVDPLPQGWTIAAGAWTHPTPPLPPTMLNQYRKLRAQRPCTRAGQLRFIAHDSELSSFVTLCSRFCLWIVAMMACSGLCSLGPCPWITLHTLTQAHLCNLL